MRITVTPDISSHKSRRKPLLQSLPANPAGLALTSANAPNADIWSSTRTPAATAAAPTARQS